MLPTRQQRGIHIGRAPRTRLRAPGAAVGNEQNWQRLHSRALPGWQSENCSTITPTFLAASLVRSRSMGSVKSSSPSLISRLAIMPRPAVSFSFSSTVSTFGAHQQGAGGGGKKAQRTNVNVGSSFFYNYEEQPIQSRATKVEKQKSATIINGKYRKTEKTK